MSRMLSQGGDLLPDYKLVVKTYRSGKVKKRMVRVKPQFKDGETPGQEWTRKEILAIRCLSNPQTATATQAAKVAQLLPRTISKWLRNPYFQNEIFKLTNSNLMNYRAEVFGSIVREATGGNTTAQSLFCRLSGDLKDEKRIKAESHAHHTFGEMQDDELKNWIQNDIRDGDDIGRITE